MSDKFPTQDPPNGAVKLKLTPGQEKIQVAFTQLHVLLGTVTCPVNQSVKVINAFAECARAVDQELQTKTFGQLVSEMPEDEKPPLELVDPTVQ